MKLALLLSVLFVFSSSADAKSKKVKIRHFRQAKKVAANIHEEQPYTLYCDCRYSVKTVDLKSCGYVSPKSSGRAKNIEWEHVVPAQVFGRAFKEWREGSSKCVRNGKKYKGRKCAKKNRDFSRMEADLHNLWPAVGEVNGMRKNYSMAELGAEKEKKGDFGKCIARVRGHKFEPIPKAKGRVARTYMYMDAKYPGRGIISSKSRPMFEAWDKRFPPDAWECRRAAKIMKVSGQENKILTERCRALGK